MPVVFPLTLLDLGSLEAKIDACVASISNQDAEDEPRIPMGVTTLFDSSSGTGYLVIDVNIGEITDAGGE